MTSLPSADLLTLVESFHIADRNVTWLTDDTIAYRSSAGLVFLNIHTSHQQLLTLPLPYTFDAFAVTPPPSTPSPSPPLIAVALHAESSAIHVYAYPSLALLHTLPSSPPTNPFTSLTFLPSPSTHLLAASATSLTLYDLPTASLLTSSPLPTTHTCPPTTLLPNPFHSSHVLSLSPTTAAVHLLTPLSTYQPPLLHHLTLPLSSPLFATSLTTSLWLSPSTLLLISSTGHLHLADLSLPPLPRVGRLGSAGQVALQAAQEAQLPVTGKEIEQLGLLPPDRAESGRSEAGGGVVGAGEMGVGVTRMVCALADVNPAWVPTCAVLTKQHIVVGTQGGALVLLDPSTFSPVYALTPPCPSPFACLTFNPAYTALLTLTEDGRMRLLHSSTSRQSPATLTAETLTSPPATPSPPSFLSSTVGDFRMAPVQGREAATALSIPAPPSSTATYRTLVYSGSTVQVWEYSPRALLSTLTLPSPVTAGCVSPDGLLAVLGLSTGAVCVLSLSPFSSPPRLIYAQVLHSSPVLHAAYAAADAVGESEGEGNGAGAGGGGVWCTMSEGEVWWIRGEDLKIIGHVRVKEVLNRTGAAVSAAALAEKERADEERRQREEDEAFFNHLLHKGKVTTQADHIAPEPDEDRPLTFTWLSDGRRLVVTSHQCQALVLTAPSPQLEVEGFALGQEELQPLFLHTEGESSLLCPHTRGERWYAVEARAVVIYELKGTALRLVSRAEGHLADITALAVSPCGRYLLTGGEDGLLLVRNAETLALLSSTCVSRHEQGGVHALSISSDSAYAVVTGRDGSTAAWHLVPLHDHSLARVTQAPSLPAWEPIIDPKVIERLPTLTLPTASAPSFLSLFAPSTIPTLPVHLAAQRKQLLSSFDTIRTLVDATRSRHSLLPPPSHLPWSTLVVDVDRREALVQEGEREVRARLASIEREVVGAELVCERIRDECWASMLVKGQVVVGLKEEEEGVRNFPLRVRGEGEVRRMRQLQLMRELELCERRWRWVTHQGVGAAGGGEGGEWGGERDRPSTASVPAPAEGGEDVNVWSRAYCEGVDYVLHSEDAQHAEVEVVEEAAAPGGAGSGTAASRGEGLGPRVGVKEGKKEGGTGGKGRAVTVPLAFDPNHASMTFAIPSFYLYHPLDVRTPSRQRVQGWLLLEKAIHVKLGFNGAFQEFYQQKQKDLATLVEKTKRLTEIQAELGTEVAIPRFELRDEEVVESVLTVSDKEMVHTRGGDAGQQGGGGVVSDAAAVEAELALMEMMNGSVESRRDRLSLLDAELAPAEWMKKAAEEMSDEEKAELARFEKKVKMIEAERESRRKMLQGEFNKVRSDCVDISRAFDVKVRAMREQRHKAQREVLHIEWLRQRLRVAEERHRAAKRQQRQTDARRAETEGLQLRLHQRMETFRVEVEAAQSTYEALGAEVKQLERTLRKEVTDAGENYDHLCKLYRIKRAKPSLLTGAQVGRRSSMTNGPSVPRHRARNSIVSIAAVSLHGPKPSLFGIEGLTGAGLNVQSRGNRRRSTVLEQKHPAEDAEDEESVLLNPYGEVVVAATAAAAAVVDEEQLPPFNACDLDAPPPDLNASLWVRFVERRRAVVEKEAEVKARLSRLQDMHRFYMRMQSVEEWLERGLDEADQQSRQGVVGEHPAWDVSLMVRIAQGLVEMSDTDAVQALDEVELRARAEVEELNRGIRAMGAAKLALISSMHEYEQERRLLEWRHRMLQLQFEQAADVTTQLHLLRVTKSMQLQLREREEGRGEALMDQLHSTVQALERKMEHIRSSTRQLNADRQVELSRVQRRTRRVGVENGELKRRVELLQEAVAQRKAIDELREEGVRERVEEDTKKMRGVVARRRLVDLAHLQREEIAWLRGQVEGLRKKTFATFAHTGHGRRAEEEKQGLHLAQQRKHGHAKQKGKKLTLPAL